MNNCQDNSLFFSINRCLTWAVNYVLFMNDPAFWKKWLDVLFNDSWFIKSITCCHFYGNENWGDNVFNLIHSSIFQAKSYDLYLSFDFEHVLARFCEMYQFTITVTVNKNRHADNYMRVKTGIQSQLYYKSFKNHPFSIPCWQRDYLS